MFLIASQAFECLALWAGVAQNTSPRRYSAKQRSLDYSQVSTCPSEAIISLCTSPLDGGRVSLNARWWCCLFSQRNFLSQVQLRGARIVMLSEYLVCLSWKSNKNNARKSATRPEGSLLLQRERGNGAHVKLSQAHDGIVFNQSQYDRCSVFVLTQYKTSNSVQNSILDFFRCFSLA